MNVDTWKRIREVFDAVIDLPEDERAIVLVRECGGDETLRRKVESLVMVETGSRLDQVVNRAILAATQAPDPTQIGNYRINKRLGEGGMGVVYEAEQSHPHRKVALKIMRAGHLATDREKRLFEREAEALGRLVHGGIATIFESGLTAQGQPYLVMEFIEGETLSAKILTEGPPPSFRRADLESRIQLFIEVCEAINYAHQRGIIHRDLKPSNIMVSHGMVKVLDFGLARIADEIENTRTETGVVQGSLRYMSPEQARGETARIDMRSDIYSLGVVLYEMITGQHPYLQTTDLMAAVYQICEAPIKPLRSIKKPVAADLETILAKAMAKDPDQRYDSVAAFAGDLRRYLANEPILARPATLRYQLRKLVERNKLAAGALAMLGVLLVAFAGISINQALRIRQERDRANQEAATARQVSDFLVNLFRETNPAETDGALTAKELLIAGRKRVAKELADKPELRARLLDNIGSAFTVVGPFEEAKKAFEESIQIRGADHPDATMAWTGLSDVYYNQGKYKESAEASAKALAIKRKYLAAEDPSIAAELNALALSLTAVGDLAQSEALFAEMEASDRKWNRGSTKDAAERLMGYGSLLRRQGKYDQAIEKLSLATTRLEGMNDVSVLAKAYNDLGMALNSAKRHLEAEAALNKAVDSSIRVYGKDHPNVGILQLNLTYSLIGQKKFSEAERKLATVHQILAKALPATHPTWMDFYGASAQVQQGYGKYQLADKDWDKALAAGKASLGPDHRRTLITDVLRNSNLAKLGRTREAKDNIERILTKLPGDPQVIAALAEIH